MSLNGIIEALLYERGAIKVGFANQETLDLACKNCSIYQTISHVSEMKTELQFG